MSTYPLTAERFCDEMNSLRVIRDRAHDEQIAEGIIAALNLQRDEILQRYCIGATTRTDERGSVTQLEFVDTSFAFQDRLSGRWVTV